MDKILLNETVLNGKFKKFIQSVEIDHRNFILPKPFRIARQEFHSIKLVNLKIIDEYGRYGLGSAAPEQGVTKETIADVTTAIQDKLKPSFFDITLDSLPSYFEKIMREFPDLPTIQAAVEECLLNLYAQKNNIPLQKLFGDFRSECDVIITIGMSHDPKETISEIEQRIKEGYRLIKLKIGLNVDKDITLVRNVCKNIPNEIKIFLDANQGYSRTDAKKFVLAIQNCAITALEQPVAAADHVGLKEITELKAMPIFADESVVSFEDAVKLINDDSINGVNIKLMKCGGVHNFKRIFDHAKNKGKAVMLGCMFESQISITTAASLALGLPIDFVDLDSGYLDFPDEPFIGGAKISDGKISIQEPLQSK